MPKKLIRNWFSNFLPFDKPFIYDGISYATPEHFYQAMKTKDRDKRAEIASASSARLAKKLGRQVEIREDWESIKYDVMLYVQRYRYRKGTRDYLGLMFANGEIVEWNNWCDKTWGRCVCKKCGGQGENMLGKILMRIRCEAYTEGGSRASRVIIAGGRDYRFTDEDRRFLDSMNKGLRITEVVSGGAKGADSEGEAWAESRSIPVKRFPADWKTHGKAAGPIRNRQMAEYADTLITFPGGRGTKNMIEEAIRAGIDYHEFGE